MLLFFRHNIGRLILLFLLVANGAVWTTIDALRPKPQVRVAFLDVGQGDSILIDSPTHRRVLIDGGPDKKVLRELSKFIPFFDRSIDLVIESHPDTDHIAGLPDVLNKYEVLGWLRSNILSNNAYSQALEKIAKTKGIKQLYAQKGGIINLGGGAKIEILYPFNSKPEIKTNEYSVVAKLTYGQNVFLFVGDLPTKQEKYLAYAETQKLSADVYKVSHHGSGNSNDLTFLKMIAPKISVISVGANNRYGHPAPEVVASLQKEGSQVWRTDQLGTIVLVGDGQEIHPVE
ncbi:MAG: ComEC/Rec2 family competence protein [Patescibacteria group bacterium]